MPPSIRDVKIKHEARLMALAGVVSVGIGRDDDGTHVLVVGLDRDRPETRASLPAELEGYRVRVRITGTMRVR